MDLKKIITGRLTQPDMVHMIMNQIIEWLIRLLLHVDTFLIADNEDDLLLTL